MGDSEPEESQPAEKEEDKKSVRSSASKASKSKAGKETKAKKDNNKKPADKPKDEPTPTGNVQSTREYLESTVTAAVQEGLLKIARERPDNPLKVLGEFLLSKAK